MDSNLSSDNPSERAETIITQIQKGVPVRRCNEFAKEYGTVIQLLNKTGQVEQIEKLQWDHYFCSLRICAPILNPPFSGKRFVSPFQPPLEFSDQIQSYCIQRINEIENPVLIARYADILWERSNLPNKHKFALTAIDNYIATAKLSLESNVVLIRFQISGALEQATYLALLLGNKEKLEEIKQILLQLVKEENAEMHLQDTTLHRGRLSFDFARLLLHIRRDKKSGELVNNVDLEQLQEKMENLAMFHKFDSNLYFEKWALSIAVDVASLIGNPETLFRLQSQFGKLLEVEGDSRKSGPGPGHLTAGAFYEEACEYYKRMRSNEIFTPEQRILLVKSEKKLKLKIRETYKLGQNEFGYITHTTEISVEEQEKQLAPFLKPDTLDECLQYLSCHPGLIPNLEEIEQLVKQMPQLTPLLSRAPRSVIGDNMTLVAANSEEERFQFSLKRFTQFSIDFTCKTTLSPVMNRLQSEKCMDTDSLMKFLKNWGYIDDDNLVIIRIGIERYFANDYISAIHILVPQFEHVLRTLFEKCGAPIIKPADKQNGWQFETFGTFLKSDSVKETLPPNLLKYIEIVMVEQVGYNLRNRIAHGLIQPELCTKFMLDTILHLFLTLTCFQTDDENVNSAE